MPCMDGREDQWSKDRQRRYDALTAVLCGIMQTDKRALSFAKDWCELHKQVDELRKAVKWDHQDERIGQTLRLSDAVLDKAHSELCV